MSGWVVTAGQARWVGALAGAALAAWSVSTVATCRRRRDLRRRVGSRRIDQGEGATASREPHPRQEQGEGEGEGWPRRAGRGDGGDGAVELAAACDAIARALRGGDSLATAIDATVDRHPVGALVEIAGAVRLGQHLPAAIDRAVERAHDPDELLALQVLAVAAEHGGPQAEAIDRAASTLRERDAVRAERRSQAASARMSTRVMTVLPFGFTGFVAATDADVRAVLVSSPVGWVCLVLGSALNLVGRAWARRAVAT